MNFNNVSNSNDMMGYDILQCWPIKVLESCENRLLNGGTHTTLYTVSEG